MPGLLKVSNKNLSELRSVLRDLLCSNRLNRGSKIHSILSERFGDEIFLGIISYRPGNEMVLRNTFEAQNLGFFYFKQYLYELTKSVILEAKNKI